MGKIFKVKIPVIDKIAALKLLAPNPFLIDTIGMKKIEELFVSEAAAMSELRHHNLLDIWDFSSDGKKLFNTMDYYCNNLGTMIGESNQVEAPSRILPVDKVFHYIRQALSGARADIYSVGRMMYRMLTGVLPEGGKGAIFPSKINPDLDEAWDDFIFKAIANDMDKRFASAEKMMDELKVLHKNWLEKMEKTCSSRT